MKLAFMSELSFSRSIVTWMMCCVVKVALRGPGFVNVQLYD